MTTFKDNLVSAAVGGATGIVTALLIVALNQHVGAIPISDALQFVGAIMGTGLAVADAVWIEGRKRKLDKSDVARPVLDALIELEDQSRPFFSSPGTRIKHAEQIERQIIVLDDVLKLSPPYTARAIDLIYRLRLAAAFITSDTYLEMDTKAPLEPGDERRQVESKLEYFDSPLKLLIVEYSRIANPTAPRSVQHLGKMSDMTS